MKNQALFSSKDKSKKLKCRLLQFLFGALRVNIVFLPFLRFLSLHPVELVLLSQKTFTCVQSTFVSVS